MSKPANKTLRSMMSVAFPKCLVDRARSKWGPILRYQTKYVRAIENQDRLNAFGVLNTSDFSSRRMNARQSRRYMHWDKVAGRMADKMDRV